MSLTTGTRLGPYEILASLGAGGMGEVYRAKDPRLKREVAIKVLPASFSADADRLRRFEQEAQAAGALNHPNITAVYDVGSHDGAPYVVQELLEGETLRSELAGGRLPPRKAIDYAIQIAQGLAAAHDKGIVHRDLKPENLFVTKDDRVKILDFGLAKLAHAADGKAAQSRLSTETPGTEPGVVLGTLGYMSPEQVRGQPADARSDIFALGAVLYEMLSGARAFRGGSAADTMSAILREEPPDLSVTNKNISPALERIVRHCLEKNAERRFQSARDLAFDLETLSAGSGVTSAAGGIAAAHPSRRWPILVAGALAVTAIAIALLLDRQLGLRQWARHSAGAPKSFRQLTLQPGLKSFPSLSPDAATVIYQAGPPGNSDVFLQRIGGQNSINLTKDCSKDDSHAAFSPSGDRIAYRSECGGGGIFLMGATGESVRRLTDFGFNPAWSPDEKEIAVSTEGVGDPYDRQGLSEIWAVDVATGQKRPVLQSVDCIQPSWSLAGGRIACWGLPPRGGQRDIWTVSARGEKEVKAIPVTNDAPTDWNPFWSPDGRFLYFASDRGGSMNLWRVAIDEGSGRTQGDPEPVTLPASWAGPLTTSRDGKHIAYEARMTLSSIQKVAFDPAGEKAAAEEATVLRGSLPILDFDVSPDGQWIAFSSSGQRQDVFVARSDGSGLRQLTDDLPKDRHPRWTRDGQRIQFMSERSGRYDIWSIHPDGSGLVQITRNTGAGNPWFSVFSPDGSTFAFPDGTNSFFFHPGKTAGEDRVEPLPPFETQKWFEVQDWSPEAKTLAGMALLMNGAGGGGIVLYRIAEGKFDRLTESGSSPKFLPDGRRLLFADKGALWVVDSDSRRKHEVLPAKNDLLLFDWRLSRDGQTLYFLRERQESEIWEAELK